MVKRRGMNHSRLHFVEQRHGGVLGRHAAAAFCVPYRLIDADAEAPGALTRGDALGRAEAGPPPVGGWAARSGPPGGRAPRQRMRGGRPMASRASWIRSSESASTFMTALRSYARNRYNHGSGGSRGHCSQHFSQRGPLPLARPAPPPPCGVLPQSPSLWPPSQSLSPSPPLALSRAPERGMGIGGQWKLRPPDHRSRDRCRLLRRSIPSVDRRLATPDPRGSQRGGAAGSIDAVPEGGAA